MQTQINKKPNYIHKRENVGLYYALPAILGFILFSLIPIIASGILSFTNYNATANFEFVGFENFIKMFSGEDVYFFKSLKVTFYYSLLFVPLSILFSFVFALLLTAKIRGIEILRTIFYLPNIVPFVATSVLWLFLFNPTYGLFNGILELFGLDTLKWIYGKNSVIPSLVFMKLWTIGGTTLIFLASLMNVPTELIEAIEIDGGNFFHKIWHVVIPIISPVIFFNLVMAVINSLQSFTEAYVMTQGGPGMSSYFYGFHIYNMAFMHQKFGYASALSWILVIISIGLTKFIFNTSKKWVHQ